MKRTETKQIRIGRLTIGGQDRVLIQSMCKHKTSDIESIINEINECEALGAKLMRVSVLDEEDAKAIAQIKKGIKIPLVADIHFDPNLAILAIKCGANKIRINPGNISDENKIKEIVELAKKKHVAIRVGANSGSVNKTIDEFDIPLAHKLILSVKEQVELLEKYDFHDIVISLKASNIKETIRAYQLASEMFPYPLHIGITEAGPYELSVIRSTAGLAPLLLEGIGDTIRISITGDSKNEVIAAKRLLHDCGLYDNYPTFISCPTCGRTQVDCRPLGLKVLKYLGSGLSSSRVTSITVGGTDAAIADIFIPS